MVIAGINLPLVETIIIIQAGIAAFLLWKILKK